jgi:outer membrane biosynthesis protein TonB
MNLLRARLVRAVRLVVALVLAAGAATACAKAKPLVVADGPALAMPLPPSRVFAPVEEPIPVQAPPPEVADAEPPKPAPRPPARRSPTPAPAEAAKPEPEPPPVAASPTPEPARELRAAPSGADAAAERQVLQLLQRAASDLKRVDYRKLSNEGRSQYDQARRFAQQAEEALKERNFVFASTLADKAAMLASQLGG